MSRIRLTSAPGEPVQPVLTVDGSSAVPWLGRDHDDLDRQRPVLGERLVAVPALVRDDDLRPRLALLPAPRRVVRGRAVRTGLRRRRRLARAQDGLAVGVRPVEGVSDDHVLAEAAEDLVPGAVASEDAIVAAAPPEIVSLPRPPSSRSFPARPRSQSSPESAKMRSARPVPVSRSAFFVPRMRSELVLGSLSAAVAAQTAAAVTPQTSRAATATATSALPRAPSLWSPQATHRR